MKLSRLLLTAAVLGGPLTTAALAQGTAFTYQGRLDDGGTPATGLYDLSFTVFNAAAGGTSAGVRTLDNVGVTNGLFTVTLDFGAGVFAGAPEWLEIAVRPGASTGAYTGLAPRQAITPTPYALYAGGASATGLTGTLPSTALGGTYAGAVNFSNKGNTFAGNAVGLTNLNAANLTGTVADARLSANVALRNGGNAFSGTQTFNNGSVGIGTSSPSGQLQVSDGTANGNMVLQALTGANSGYEFLGFNGYFNAGPVRINPAKARYRVLADQRGSTDAFVIDTFDTSNVGHNAIGISPSGNVGIGTTTPIAPLEVSGVDAAPSVSANNQVLSVRSSPTLIGLNFGHYPNGSYASWIQSQRTSDNSTWGLALNPLGGSVGIGTATPRAKLEVAGEAWLTSAGDNYLSIIGNGGASGLDLATVSVPGNWSSSAAVKDAVIRSVNGKLHLQSGGGAAAITIDPGNNVGIGTATPGAKLELYDMGTYGLRVQSQAGGTLASFGAGGDFSIDAPFFAGGRLMVKESGNVGIGTAAPAAKLDVVNGAAGVNAIVVTQSGDGASAIFAENTTANGYAGYFKGAVGVSSEITCVAVNLTSDRNAKEKFKAVNPREVLAKVVDLPITEWQYKSRDQQPADEARHLGPMAQDFHAAFALGHDEKHITSIDEDGVALAAIQGLNEKVEETRAENVELRQTVRELKSLVEQLKRSLPAPKGE